MQSKQCAACRKVYRPRPQVPQQRYCATPDCQRERRRRWQQTKRVDDPDYRDNQARAQLAWCKKRPHYWREYRRAHPQYVERNRMQQRERNGRGRDGLIAKKDASPPFPLMPSGIYRVIPVELEIAKMIAWTVEITLLSGPHDRLPPDCKERTS